MLLDWCSGWWWRLGNRGSICPQDTVYFGLGLSNGGDYLGVCDFTTLGDGGFCYKEDGVGDGGHAGPDDLGEAS